MIITIVIILVSVIAYLVVVGTVYEWLEECAAEDRWMLASGWPLFFLVRGVLLFGSAMQWLGHGPIRLGMWLVARDTRPKVPKAKVVER